jgi:hypothetical protein
LALFLAKELVTKGEIGKIKHAMVMFDVLLGFLFNDPKQEGWVKPTGTILVDGLTWRQLAHTFLVVDGFRLETKGSFCFPRIK